MHHELQQLQACLPGLRQHDGRGAQLCVEVAAEELATTFRWHRLELWLQLRQRALDENSAGIGLMRCFRALSTWKELYTWLQSYGSAKLQGVPHHMHS